MALSTSKWPTIGLGNVKNNGVPQDVISYYISTDCIFEKVIPCKLSSESQKTIYNLKEILKNERTYG